MGTLLVRLSVCFSSTVAHATLGRHSFLHCVRMDEGRRQLMAHSRTNSAKDRFDPLLRTASARLNRWPIKEPQGFDAVGIAWRNTFSTFSTCTDWALDPEGIDLPRDEEVEKAAAVLALRVLVEKCFQESTALDLVVRVNDEDSNEVFVLRAEFVPDGSITRRRRSGTKTTERTTFDRTRLNL